jgi:hypothetical protein
MTTYIEDTWTRIEEANITAGWPNDWTVAERDQMEALARILTLPSTEQPSMEQRRIEVGAYADTRISLIFAS